MRKTFLLILLIVVAIIQGCVHVEESYEPTFTLRQFYNMPIEDKVIEYIKSLYYIHNLERMFMEDMIVLHGKEVVPIALGIVAADIDGNYAERFMFILELVHLCCYDLNIDPRYKDLLEYVMENSRDEFNRSSAKTALGTIVTEKGARNNMTKMRDSMERGLDNYEKNINLVDEDRNP